MKGRIKNIDEYEEIMNVVEDLLKTATRRGGFHELSMTESKMLADLSKQAEDFEDSEMKIMEI